MVKHFYKILLIALLAVVLPIVGIYAWFIHTSIWQYNADFEGYEAEVQLVCDYVLEYTDGRTGVFSYSLSEGHEYDLYDDIARKYVDCPEEVRNALEIICRDAFNVNSHLCRGWTDHDSHHVGSRCNPFRNCTHFLCA